MKGLHWTIVSLGIVLSISSIVLRVDGPVTPYDESETPFNLVAPISFNIVAYPLTLREGRRFTILERERVRRHDGATTYTSQFHLKLLSKTLLCKPTISVSISGKGISNSEENDQTLI